jgi:nucleotide-binding universal stress UspA family protein
LYKNILVPIDGSESSHRALIHAVNLAKIHGSEITVISVIEELKLPFGAEYRLWANESHQELIRTSLECINKEIISILEKEPDIKIDAEIIEGNPALSIIKIAEEKKHDLIIMGKTGMSFVEELVIGSVTHKVVKQSIIPVTVVA